LPFGCCLSSSPQAVLRLCAYWAILPAAFKESGSGKRNARNEGKREETAGLDPRGKKHPRAFTGSTHRYPEPWALQQEPQRQRNDGVTANETKAVC
jgi:hypothetical protein